MMIAIQQTANDFDALVQEHKYEEASKLLADDFILKSPFVNCGSKAEWLKKFPKAHGKMPNIPFEFKQKKGNNQIERRGTKKIALFNINIKQIIEVDKDGKIKRMTASKE